MTNALNLKDYPIHSPFDIFRNAFWCKSTEQVVGEMLLRSKYPFIKSFLTALVLITLWELTAK